MTTTETRRDEPGTTYLLPTGETLRLLRYEGEPFREPPIEDDDPEAHPLYDYWSAEGGAAGGVRMREGLPEGTVVVVPVAPAHVPIGAVYVDEATGDFYRLRDYAPDFLVEEGLDAGPMYSVMLAGGAFTNARGLPETARLVWLP